MVTGAVTPVEYVIAGSTHHVVVTSTAGNKIVHWATRHKVHSTAAIYLVISSTATVGVVPAKTSDDVVSVRTDSV